MTRLKKMMPRDIKPAFTTAEELLAWQQEQGKLRSASVARENQAMKMQRTFKRSGIRELHMNCSFDNYQVIARANESAGARQEVRGGI
jgi:DNA replication protein DnaC